MKRVIKAYIEAVGAMNHDKEATLKVPAKYFKRNDPNFLGETYGIVTKFTEKTPRVDTRNMATVLEFEPVKGVDAETLTPKVIDNSVVDKLAKRALSKRFLLKWDGRVRGRKLAVANFIFISDELITQEMIN